MSRLWALVMVVLYVLYRPAAAAAIQLEPAVERQEIAVTLVPGEHLLIGESAITFAAGTKKVTLQLSPTAIIASVKSSGTDIPYIFSNGTLAMDIPKTAGHGAVSIKIAYRVTFNDPLPLHPGSSEDPTYGVTGTITSQGTFLADSAGWYPAPLATPQNRSVRIAAPAGVEALTAGKRVSRRTEGAVSHSAWEELRPIGRLTLCAGNYRIEESRVAGVDLYTYFYPGNASLAARYLDAAAKYLAFYTDLFGPYPFEKFAVVENFFPTGYSFPSFTLLGSSVIRLPFIIDTSFPHEIAHSWWGNAIQVDQGAGNWSEGLVTYLADYLLKERQSAAEGRDYRRQILADYAALVPPAGDFPLSGFTSRTDPASRAIGYGKGAMFFHMIRNRIGDRAFFDALRQICQERLYRTAGWSDFERAFMHSSGRELSSFFKQWLTRPGGPRLAFSQVTRRRDGQGWLVSGAVVQSYPYYDLQLPLSLETDGPPVQNLLPVTGALTRFSIASITEPRHLRIDPDAAEFRLLASSEIPATINRVKSSQQLIIIMTKDCRAREKTFKRLLESLGQGKAPIIREDELDAMRIDGHDLMFCGMPKQRSLLPPLPAGISLHDTALSVQAELVPAPDGLIFLVLQDPSRPERIAALFRPLSETAAEQYSAKITHYGKYGSLVFTGGAIRHKSTIPPAAGVSDFSF